MNGLVENVKSCNYNDEMKSWLLVSWIGVCQNIILISLTFRKVIQKVRQSEALQDQTRQLEVKAVSTVLN